ncbi:MAG: Txe/YoeB family addiction module toxin [Ginsengibacter sp.]
MEVDFDEEAKDDLDFWKKSGNITVQKKIQQLLFSINESPYTGTGKPEPLKYDLAGKWSRRINNEHRLIYSIFDK